jgi:hypothetical protein
MLRDLAIHVGHRRSGGAQPLGSGLGDVGIGEQHVALGYPVAIIERGAIEQLCPRITLVCSALEPRHRRTRIAVLEQHHAKLGLGIDMAEPRSAGVPVLRLAEVDRHSATEAIGLPDVEHRVGIAPCGEWAPLAKRGGIVPAAPRFDPATDALG